MGAEGDLANQLIDDVNSRQAVLLPNGDWLPFLKKITAFNDGKGGSGVGRVSAERVIEALQEHFGWQSKSRKTLDKLCKQSLGRRSFSKQ